MIILIVESGSGKSTILNELSKIGYQKAIDYTTRPKRPGDDQLQDMRFISKQEFENMWNEGKILQRAEFNGEYYGLSIYSLADNVVCISIVDSIRDIKRRAKELGKDGISIKVFYIRVPLEERIKRMLKRGDSIDMVQKRISIDKEKFRDVYKVADYVIDNDNLDMAVDKILEIARI